jgi:hypothetical protein
MKKIISLTMILLFINSCSRTIKTWENTPIKEYFEVYGKDNLPQKLEEEGVDYKCINLVYSTEGYTKKCYVAKNSKDKLKDWRSKLYKTSKAVLLDTGENITIIGMLSLCIFVNGIDCSKIHINNEE